MQRCACRASPAAWSAPSENGVARKGIIRAQWTGGDAFLQNEIEQGKNIRAEVTKLLAENAPAADVVLEALNETDEWAKSNIHAVAEQLSPSIGLPASVLEVSLQRESYGTVPINSEVIASQQRVADAFFALGLIPKAVNVSDLQRKPGS